MRDAPAGTSLLQSQPEIDHRDHHHKFLHKHEHLHQRHQANPLVPSITSIISVIQEVVVDQNGSTLLKTILAASPTVDTPADYTVPPPTDTPESVPTPASLPVPASHQPKPVPTPDVLNVSAAAAPATTPSSTIDASLFMNTSPPVPVTSTPFIGSSNSSIPTSTTSTSLESSLSSLPNRTTSSSTHTSITSLTGISSLTSAKTTTSLSEESSSSIFVSFSSDSYFSSDSPTATVGFAPLASAGGVGGGAGGAAGGHTPTGSATATTTATATGDAAGAGDGGQSTPTTVVVGGVVGAIAGVVFIVAVVLVFIRWRKRKQSLLPLGSGDNPNAGPATAEISGGTPSQPREMTKRATAFAIPAALANLTGYRRATHQSSVDHSSTAGSERGFYRVSGRKLPSVFQHGGDGYGGDGYGGGHESLGGSSFYRDSHGGLGSPTSPFANRESGVPITRPSPARTPVISEGAFASPSPATTSPTPSILPPQRPDVLGRSHPSRDGSHVSKFTEQV